jgi:hypothetical protein
VNSGGIQWGTIAGMITALATMVTAFGGIYLGRRVQSVHKIVNQQRTDMLNYQRALIAALKNHGVDVPDDQSAGDPR